MNSEPLEPKQAWEMLHEAANQPLGDFLLVPMEVYRAIAPTHDDMLQVSTLLGEQLVEKDKLDGALYWTRQALKKAQAEIENLKDELDSIYSQLAYVEQDGRTNE